MTIKAIALYKSRFGAIEYYDVNKFDKEKFNEVLEKVRVFINEYYHFNRNMSIKHLWQGYLSNKNNENNSH